MIDGLGVEPGVDGPPVSSVVAELPVFCRTGILSPQGFGRLGSGDGASAGSLPSGLGLIGGGLPLIGPGLPAGLASTDSLLVPRRRPVDLRNLFAARATSTFWWKESSAASSSSSDGGTIGSLQFSSYEHGSGFVPSEVSHASVHIFCGVVRVEGSRSSIERRRVVSAGEKDAG